MNWSERRRISPKRSDSLPASGAPSGAPRWEETDRGDEEAAGHHRRELRASCRGGRHRVHHRDALTGLCPRAAGVRDRRGPDGDDPPGQPGARSADGAVRGGSPASPCQLRHRRPDRPTPRPGAESGRAPPGSGSEQERGGSKKPATTMAPARRRGRRAGPSRRLKSSLRVRAEDRKGGKGKRKKAADGIRNPDGSPAPSNPGFMDALPGPSRDGRSQLRDPQVPRAGLPAADLPGRGHPVRRPLGDPGGDQRDRDRLRPQPERLLRGRARVDAVHPLVVAGVWRRCEQGRQEGPLQPGRRDLRRRPLPEGGRLREGRAPLDLRLQPRRLVRRLA